MRKCKHCDEFKSIDEFQYKNGYKCKECYKKSNREKHARYRATNHNNYVQKDNIKTAKWRRTTKGRTTRAAYMRKYSKTPRGREIALRGLYKFIERHPFYNLEYLERLIKINEGTYSLDAFIFDDSKKRFIDNVTYEDMNKLWEVNDETYTEENNLSRP